MSENFDVFNSRDEYICIHRKKANFLFTLYFKQKKSSSTFTVKIYKLISVTSDF